MNFCRLCLKMDSKEEFYNIFWDSLNFFNKPINVLIKECTSVQINESDPFSKLICKSCIDTLKISYSFQQMCMETNKKLQGNYQISILELSKKNDRISKDMNKSPKENYKEKIFESVSKRRKKIIHKKQGIVCEICGKEFTQETNFTVHMRTHTGVRPFTCCQCGISKITEGDLKSHMKIHSDECNYSCYICGKRFKWLSNLLRHIRWHTGERSHKCNICNKSFFELGDLKKHTYTHTGEKPYKCPYCNKAFQRKGHLNNHCNSKHKE